MKVTTPVIDLTGLGGRTRCAETECPNCHTTHRAYCTLSSDPQATADHITTEAANSWLRTHPCNRRLAR